MFGPAAAPLFYFLGPSRSTDLPHWPKNSPTSQFSGSAGVRGRAHRAGAVACDEIVRHNAWGGSANRYANGGRRVVDGDLHIIHLLTETQKVDFSTRDCNGESVLDIAKKLGKQDVVAALAT